MTARRIASFLLIAVAALAYSVTGAEKARAESIGVAPTSFDFENMIRGEEYRRTITIWHDSADERGFSFEVTGDLAEWISFFDMETDEPIEALFIPNEGVRSKGAAGMKVSIPEDAANGFYTGEIRVSAIANDPTGGASAATVGAVLNVFADVSGDQVLAGQIRDASAISIETGVPLRVDFRISNDGNVEITPRFDIKIMDSDGSEALTHQGEVEPIGPGEIVGRSLEIDSTPLRLGDYTATVDGSFRSLNLGETTISFTVLERGTLSRSGTITRIGLANEPQVGDVARLQVEFQNTGDIEANAIFEGQVFVDGELVDVITSLPKLVTAGQRDALELFFDIDREGEYVVTGKVNFDGKESQVVELTYSSKPVPDAVDPAENTTDPVDNSPADPDSGGSSAGLIITIVIILIVLGGGAGGAFYLGRKRGWRMPAVRRRTNADAV